MEISIALLLLTLIATGVLQFFSQGTLYLKKSREHAVACNLAQEVMERYLNWSTLPPSGVTINPDPLLYPASINNVTYNAALTISDGPIQPTSLKQLEVVISWGNETYRLVSLKADFIDD